MENCAYCEDFVCKKVAHLLGSRGGLLVFCRPEGSAVTQEEYELCMRQFDSLPNAVQMLVDAGRLAAWVEEKPERGRVV